MKVPTRYSTKQSRHAEPPDDKPTVAGARHKDFRGNALMIQLRRTDHALPGFTSEHYNDIRMFQRHVNMQPRFRPPDQHSPDQQSGDRQLADRPIPSLPHPPLSAELRICLSFPKHAPPQKTAPIQPIPLPLNRGSITTNVFGGEGEG